MPRLFTICALLAAPTILLGPALLPDRALLPADLLVQFEPWRSQFETSPGAHWDPLVWDGIAQYYPWRLFAAESLRAGHLPLWNPYQFCGTPFLANGQSAVLYPLNLLFLALPVARAFGFSAWLHLILAGWFAYLFLRRIGAARIGALCGAVVWQTNSFFVAWLHLPTAICTASWLPLILLCCERALVTGRARHALGGGVALALSYLGGHPQFFLFVALLSTLYLLCRALSRAIVRQGLATAAGKLVRASATTAATAVGLAAAQLLPTLDLLRIAHRAFTPGPESYAAFLSRALPAPLLANLLLPHPFGHPNLGTYIGPENYAEYCSYLGIVALAFALWGALSVRTWHARFFAAAALLAMLVAVGTPLNWPLYRWLPGTAGAGGPARIVLLAVFSLSMLAGLGVDVVVSRGGKASAPLRGPALALALVVMAAIAWWRVAGPAVGQIESGIIPETNTEVTRAIILALVTAGLLTGLRRPPLRHLSQVSLVVVLAADLLLAAQHHAHIVPLRWVYPADANLGAPAGRVLGNAADWPLRRFPRAILPPNAATVYHLRDAFGYDSLYLAQYRDFAALIQGGDPSPPVNGNLLLARLGPSYGWDAMSLAGVGTVFSPGPVRGLQLERAGAFDTYRNPYARPRAWVTESAVFLRTRQEAVAAMVRLGPLQDVLIITGPDRQADKITSGPRPTAQVHDISPNEVVVDLPQGGGGYLFLADSFAPGWHAYAGGRELPVLIADVAFRAVIPPRAARSVVCRYQPASFRVGLFVTLVASAALAAACVSVRQRGST